MSEISQRLLPWFDQFGRKYLPWQQDKTPYKVWISEIMLQQTQVNTVIPYYEKFMRRFPDIASLAAASEDEVLKHWSGLGYYARARNLHKCAKQIQAQYGGVFPDEFEAVIDLPGIGRSTAGAILSLASHQRHSILDGNVKRVLSRVYCVAGWAGQARVARRLWQLAEQNTPRERVADYNQAIMDLGATLCVRGNKPACEACPLSDICQAYQWQEVGNYPQGKPRQTLPVKSTVMLLGHRQNQELIIEKRPPAGIWGGLWSLPEFADMDSLQQWLDKYFEYGRDFDLWEVRRHSFSHYHLDIQPVLVEIKSLKNIVMERQEAVWYNLGAESDRGFPAPVSALMQELQHSAELATA